MKLKLVAGGVFLVVSLSVAFSDRPQAAEAFHVAATLDGADEEIAAPCERVWLTLLDRSSWMQSFVSRETVSGRAGQVGEVVFVRTNYHGVEGSRFEKTLLAQAASRLVLSLIAPQSKTTVFADYKLDPVKGGCAARLSLYLAQEMPPSTDLDDAVSKIDSVDHKKISDDFLHLKLAAEKTRNRD